MYEWVGQLVAWTALRIKSVAAAGWGIIERWDALTATMNSDKETRLVWVKRYLTGDRLGVSGDGDGQGPRRRSRCRRSSPSRSFVVAALRALP